MKLKVHFLLTMCTVINIITNTVLILSTNFRNIIPFCVNSIKEFTTMISFVFLSTKFANSRSFEERNSIYSWPQNNLNEFEIDTNQSD